MRSAFITGISGQTGSYLAEQLVAEGWQVTGMVRAFDDEAAAMQARLPETELHVGDLDDAPRLHELVSTVRPDAIFNLGGLSSVAESWKNPELTARITGLAVATLLNAAWSLQQESGRRVSFVQASSAEIFGDAAEVPQTENTPVRPVNPYGAAKAYAHHLVGVYRRMGLGASACILYNHESPRRPETFVTRKITVGVARVAAGLSDTVVLGNLDARRDWGWAPDYARAIALAATGEPGDYVVATGESHTVAEFVQAAFSAAGISNWQDHVEQDARFMRPQDSPEQVGDASHASAVLGWEPQVGFSDVVAQMVDHDLRLLRES